MSPSSQPPQVQHMQTSAGVMITQLQSGYFSADCKVMLPQQVQQQQQQQVSPAHLQTAANQQQPEPKRASNTAGLIGLGSLHPQPPGKDQNNTRKNRS